MTAPRIHPTGERRRAADPVPWRDLVRLSPAEKLHELTICLPWLAGSLACYAAGWVVPGLLASFMFFLTGLRQSHNAQHGNIGIGRRGHDAVMAALSVLMLTSMHAVQVTHLHHHRHCLGEDDVEAATARMPWWKAVLVGPVHIVRLHAAAWRLGKPRHRRWIAAELAAVAAVVLSVLVLPEALPGALPADGVIVQALRWHVVAMLVGECFTGFFAVWTVHHGCVDDQPAGRTLRRPWLNRLTYHMFLHAEHHLYPAVPTGHLTELGRRIDAAGQDIARHPVVGPPTETPRDTPPGRLTRDFHEELLP